MNTIEQSDELARELERRNWVSGITSLVKSSNSYFVIGYSQMLLQ
jgi:hypothetical protein